MAGKNGNGGGNQRSYDHASEEYKNRLSKWIQSEQQRLGDGYESMSFRRLADRWTSMLAGQDETGFTASQLEKWVNKKYSIKITDPVLIRIAKVRGDSLAETKAWLEKGEEELQKDATPLVVLMHERDLIEVAHAVAAGLERLRQWQSFQKFMIAIPKDSLPRLISLLYGEQSRQRMLGDDKKFAEYLGIDVETLDEIRGGRFPWNQDVKDGKEQILGASRLADKVADEGGNYGNWQLFAKLLGFSVEA